MPNLITRVKDWMEWRGISLKDLVMAGCALGFLVIVLSVFLRGACLAL